MGHTRLGSIPKSKKWKQLVNELAEGMGVSGGALSESVEQIVEESLRATEYGLGNAVDDRGLRWTFYLLTQIALSSRKEDWDKHLREFGINLSANSTAFDLTVELQGAIDNYLFENRAQSDVSEIAQQAAGEALSSLVEPYSRTLFGEGKDELQSALRKVSTKKGFGLLAQKFFGAFVARYLNFFLSRVTADHLGSKSVRQLGDLTKFDKSLRDHCDQSANIVRDFSGEWYSKTEYLKGIDIGNTSNFMAVALKKLQAELKVQRGGE